MYAILGCGRFGYEIILGLDYDKKDILIIDEKKGVLTALEKRGYKIQIVEKLTENVIEENLDKIQKVYILGDNGNTNMILAKTARKQFPQITIISNAPTKESEEKIRKIEDVVTFRAHEVAKNALKSAIDAGETEKTASQLRKILQKSKDETIGIFSHNEPDPDSIASALAFQKICEKEGVHSKIYYGGEISHQENIELVRLLEIELHRIGNEDELAIALQNSSKIVLIESAFPSENNVLPKDVVPNIVLDHHSTSRDVIASDLVDVRSDVGALSTALTIYLQQFDVKMDAKMATALLYALKVDTKSFTRNVSPTDLKAAAFLSPFADGKLLKRIESPPMSSDTMDVIGRAIVNREIKEGVLFSSVGYVEERDALPQAVEFMMRESDVRIAGMCGIRGFNIHISARSNDPNVHIGEVVKTAFAEFGSGGGHATSAGVQISLDRVNIKDKSDKELIANIVANLVRKIFFTGLGIDISTKTI